MKDRKKEVNKMSKYSDFLKQRKTNGLDFFLGRAITKQRAIDFKLKPTY